MSDINKLVSESLLNEVDVKTQAQRGLKGAAVGGVVAQLSGLAPATFGPAAAVGAGGVLLAHKLREKWNKSRLAR